VVRVVSLGLWTWEEEEEDGLSGKALQLVFDLPPNAGSIDELFQGGPP
jgi:hypothetical protein